MSSSINAPTPQPGPIAWAVFCLFGAAIGLSKLPQFPVGSSGWIGGVLLVVMAGVALITIDGFWFASQRQIQIGPESVEIRRWVEVWLNRPGVKLDLHRDTVVRLVLERGKRLRIDSRGRSVNIWVGLWKTSELQRLVSEFERFGIMVRADWAL